MRKLERIGEIKQIYYFYPVQYRRFKWLVEKMGYCNFASLIGFLLDDLLKEESKNENLKWLSINTNYDSTLYKIMPQKVNLTRIEYKHINLTTKQLERYKWLRRHLCVKNAVLIKLLLQDFIDEEKNGNVVWTSLEKSARKWGAKLDKNRWNRITFLADKLNMGKGETVIYLLNEFLSEPGSDSYRFLLPSEPGSDEN